MSLLGGRRLERWITEHAGAYPNAARYLRTFVLGLAAKKVAERQIESQGEQYFSVLDRTVSTLTEQFSELVPNADLPPSDLEGILEALSKMVGAMPHEEHFEDFDEVAHAFYDKPAYPMLEHLMYLSPLGIERLGQVSSLAAAAKVPEEARFADLGVGPAAIFLALLEAHPGWSGSGFDVSAHCIRYAGRALEHAKIAAERYELIEADARSLPTEDECFDLVLATEIVEHVPDPDVLLTEIARVLRPGGSAIVSAPTNLPWGPHLSVFETTEEIEALYSKQLVVERMQSFPIQRNALMTFALLRKRGQAPI